MATVKEIITGIEGKMHKSVDALRVDLASLRAGRATPSLLEKVMVDYYGAPTPVTQVASVSVPEPRMITIQPWERNMIKEIEKAIMKSDLGLNPNSDGVCIRLNLPQLTEERRKELAKRAKTVAEETKVGIRNIRRNSNDDAKKLKDEGVSEDEVKMVTEKIQELTDKYVKKIDELCELKVKDILTV